VKWGIKPSSFFGSVGFWVRCFEIRFLTTFPLNILGGHATLAGTNIRRIISLVLRPGNKNPTSLDFESEGEPIMNKFHTTLKLFVVLCFTLAVASAAQAQATRTWVSGVGDDVNPCSRTAPCKTFAGAISKTAANGEIDCIDPGGFGAVTITKGITIDGAGTMGSILASLTNGIIVNDAATPPTAVVTIRNLSINGAGNGLNGIRILKARTVHVENVEIFGFTGNGIDAPLTAAASDVTELYFDDVDIRSISGAGSVGIKLSAPLPGMNAYLDHCHIERVATGLQAGNNSFPVIRNSVIVKSANNGVEMVSGASGSPKATIENTLLSNNTTALSAGSGTTTFLSQSTITGCVTGIAAGGGVVQSSGNNRILGNGNDGLTPTIVNPK
jgi:hypothetical protein